MNDQQAFDVLATVIHEVAPELDLSDVDLDADLHTELDLDSMDFLNLVTGIHEQTGIDIPERDYGRLTSLGGFSAYLVEVSRA
jgi:acyl carrier protein